jgi:hypothetical protein
MTPEEALKKLRETVHAARESAKQWKDQHNRVYLFGLIYDSIGWTKEDVIFKNIDTLNAAVNFAIASDPGPKTLMSLRKMLTDAGFNTAPPQVN